MESLNVGCGSDPWGDVRVDVAFSFITAHFKHTVLADAHYLPFKDGSFEVVKASHVLEHLSNPSKALNEILRVATREIVLKFPTEYDVLLWFISNVLPIPSFSTIRWTYITRKRGLHLWVINPKPIIEYLKQKGWKVSYEKGSVCFFATLETGRKAKYFRWLTKHFRILVNT
jgi:ubiquinone/menaquinone biosynthesis C-methylase UbiE